MAYAQAQSSHQKIATLGAVAALHVAAGYVLVTGLAASGIIDDLPTLFQARNITADVPPETPPPQQPAQTDPAAPPRQASSTVIKPAMNFDTTPVKLPDLGSLTPDLPNDRIVVPPPETPRFTPEPAQPRNNPGNWVTEADYSSRAMRLGMEGVTRFTLTIGADGRVSDCQVTGSSGHAELDTAACQLIAKRARFEPARNDKGDKIAGSYSSAVRWTIRN